MSDPGKREEVEVPAEIELELLVAALEASREEAEARLDDLKRVAADFDNFRKRTAKESEMILDRATERLVVGLLPTLDSFDAALATHPESETERLLFSGMVNTREQLLKALEAEGLRVIPTIGEVFDPEVHEPIGAPDGTGRLIVSAELRRGYRLHDRVVRAALVQLEAEE